MKKIFLALCATICSCSLFAVIASPEPFTVTQPDGSVITVRLKGDEFHSFYTRLDGTPIRRDDKGFWIKDESVRLETDAVRKSRHIAQATNIAATFPLTGSPRTIVILVSFSDVPFQKTKEQFDLMLNQSGYSDNKGTGSARDYFIASSDSIFSPIFDVYGPYTLSNTQAFYGKHSGRNNDSDVQLMIKEACSLAEQFDNVNFADYDTNNDGVVDNVFVYYAGHNEAEGGGEDCIWPHRSTISDAGFKLNGKTLGDYATTSELRAAKGSEMCGIGTFCHEFGHVLGHPDFYDTEYDHYTVADWDIMCSGSYNNEGRTPPVYTSYERFYLGWLKPVQLNVDEPGNYFLEPLETSNKAYLLAASTHNLNGSSPNPQEFFMLENRQHVGWDAPEGALPGVGMLVWHIDYNVAAWLNNTPNNGKTMLRMHLEEANGVNWKRRGQADSGTASDPYPGKADVHQFNATAHDGTPLLQPVFNIKQIGELISFVYINDGENRLAFEGDLETFVTTIDNRKIVDWNPQMVKLVGQHLIPKDTVILSAGADYYLFSGEQAPARTSSDWRHSIGVPVDGDSAVNANIFVSYVPSKQKCDVSGTTITASASNAIAAVAVESQAPRPVYVTTPVFKKTTDITPYSFRVNWKPVTDAVEYYLTLYTMESGESSVMQGFENFDDAAAIAQAGWYTNFLALTGSAKSEGVKALWMKNTGDTVISEQYPVNADKISFWYNALGTSSDAIGILTVEGFDGKKWVKLPQGVLNIKSSDKKKTASFDLAGAGYTRFRLSYEALDGSGIAVDEFTASFSTKLTYIYRNKDITVEAVSGSGFVPSDYTYYNFSNMTPNMDYYVRIQTTDGTKGCTEHITAQSDPIKITTLNGYDIDSKHLTVVRDSINYNPAQHVVYLPVTDLDHTLYIFDTSGHLRMERRVYPGENAIALPNDIFTVGNIYIIKYTENNKLVRKDKWTKIIY